MDAVHIHACKVKRPRSNVWGRSAGVQWADSDLRTWDCISCSTHVGCLA